MKNKELIQVLQSIDPESNIVISINWNQYKAWMIYCWDWVIKFVKQSGNPMKNCNIMDSGLVIKE